MPLTFDRGVDESNDATALLPGQLQEAKGAEYRVGSSSIWSARGRALAYTVSGVSWIGMYAAGFDNDTDQIITQGGSSYFYARVLPAGQSMSATGLTAYGAGAMPIIGVHFANRHYTADGSANMCLEPDNLVPTVRTPGMIAATVAAGVSVTQGTSIMSAIVGLEYWWTEYDQTRGIESIAGVTANTGAFSDKDSVIVIVTGTSVNSNATHWRLYRSTDGGVFPDGGLLTTLAIGTTIYTDTEFDTSSAILPAYGNISINGLDFDRDEAPPVWDVVGGPFDNSLLAFATDDQHNIRFTPAGFPESWPSIYSLPIQTARHDKGVAFVVLNGQVGAFTRDTVWRVTRLPREVDAVYAAGEAAAVVTDDRGAVSRRGVVTFTMPGRGKLAAFVARDGIWATNLAPNMQIPLTDGQNWDGRVDSMFLEDSELHNDPLNRRLVFTYRGVGDSYPRRIMYLDYQREDVRVTHADHGPLSAMALSPYDCVLRLFSTDSRAANGQVYIETYVDADESDLVSASGQIDFSIQTPEIFPASPHAAQKLGSVVWMHGDGPAVVNHHFYVSGSTAPQYKELNWTARAASSIGLEKNVLRFSLRVAAAPVTSFPVHWADVEGLEKSPSKAGE